MLANYHTHTRWCGHGVGEIEDYILAAIQGGLLELAITEHVPRRRDYDRNRMRWEEFPAFNQELDEMVEKYKNQICVRKGLECEYYPDQLAQYAHFRDALGYKLLVLAQHTTSDMRYDSFCMTKPSQLERYAQDVCAGLETGMFSFLAHPDVIMCGYPHWDSHARHAMERVFAACARLNVPVEINANGHFYRRGYPCRAVWELAADFDLQCIINADAHCVENLLGPSVYACEAMAQELGLSLLSRLP